MNTLDVGKFISELRKEKGLTQKELAEKLRVTDKAVSKWETGRSAPDISLLASLSEILGVTVVEILQGERIEAENLPTVSDEVVVRTIKKDEQKLKRSIFIAVIVLLVLIFSFALSYPAYHFFTSVPMDNEQAILRQARRQYADVYGEADENMKIVKSVKKGDYFFFLLQSENKTSMRIFQTDEIFDDRISLTGGGTCSEPNEVNLYCTAMGYTTINVFYGYDMTDTEYSYYYRGVKCTKLIEDELLLDVIIDIDDLWTYADIIYDN